MSIACSSVQVISEADFTQVDELIQSVGWHVSDWKLRMYHHLTTTYGIEKDGKLLGTAAVVTWDNYAALGNVIVHPEAQRRGYGQRLINHILHTLSVPARLLATEAGERLYLRNDFLPKTHLVRWIREKHGPDIETSEQGHVVPLRCASPETLDRLIQQDSAVSGADRSRLYHALHRTSETSLITLKPNSFSSLSPVTPFCLCTEEPFGMRIGPLVANSVLEAATLIRTAMTHFPQNITIDVFLTHTEVAACLQTLGFQRSKQSPYMVHGQQEPSPTHLAYIAPFDAAIL